MKIRSIISIRKHQPVRRVAFGLLAAFPGLCACLSGPPGAAAEARPLVPEIDGAWWQIAGNPDLGPLGRPGQEPVDFAIWRAADGTCQLWSCIRKTGEEGHTRLLHRWESPEIARPDWKPMGIAMWADPRCGEQPGGLQAPFVFRDRDRYYMAYGDWERICLAASADGKEFTRVLDPSGSSAVFGETSRANARDRMVLRIGPLWHCYYTGAPEGKGADFARVSPDLKSWGPRKTVHSGGKAGDGPWSAECPHVVGRGGYYYLFRTQYYGRGNITHVYRSADPLDFHAKVGAKQRKERQQSEKTQESGQTKQNAETEESFVVSLPVAAPEIVLDRRADGEAEYIAALNPGLDGIRVARLRWVPPAK